MSRIRWTPVGCQPMGDEHGPIIRYQATHAGQAIHRQRRRGTRTVTEYEVDGEVFDRLADALGAAESCGGAGVEE